MPNVIPITDFRKDIFNLADELYKSGGSLVVTKEPGLMFKFMPVKNDKAMQAGYVLKYVLPKVGGMWKNKSKKEMKFITSMRDKNNPVEKEYAKRYKDW